MTRRTVIVFVLVGSIVLVLAGAGVVTALQRSAIRFDVRTFSTLLNAPQEVKDMLFVSKTEDGESLSRLTRFGGIQTFNFPAKHFIGIARGEDGTTLAVVEQTGNGAVDVYRVEKDTLTPLTTDGGKKGGITISPDASRFAYSTEGPALPGTIEDAYDVRRYTTHVVDASGDEVFSLPGNHPYFLTDMLLFTMSEQGLTVTNIENNDSSAVPDDLAFLTAKYPEYASSGAFLVQNPVTQETLLMKLVSLEAALPVLLTVFPAEERAVFALKGENLYRGAVSHGTFTLARLDGEADTGEGTTLLSLSARVLEPVAIIP